MISQEIIQTAINTYFAANNARDVDGFVNAFAADASMYNAGEVSPISGHDAIRQVALQTLMPIRETSVMMERAFISGDGAAVFYSGHLIAENGRKARIEGIDVFEVNDEGKIQTIRFYFDPAPVLALFQDEAAL